MPPLLISMVLGSLTEMSLRQSLIMSDGSVSIFYTRPICLVFLLLAVFSAFLPLIQSKRRKAAQKKSTV